MPISSSRLARLLALRNAVLFFVTSVVLIRFSRSNDEAVLLWPANALVIALLARQQRVNWIPSVATLWFAGTCADLLGTTDSWALAAAFAGINVAAVCCGTRLLTGPLRTRLPLPTLNSAQGMQLWALCALAFPTLRAVPNSLLLNATFGSPFWPTLANDWVSDAVGASLFALPIYLYTPEAARRLVARPCVAENLLLSLGALFLTYLAIHYVRFPFVVIGMALIVPAFRMGAFGAACLGTITGLSLIALWQMGVRPHGLTSAEITSAVLRLPFPALAATLVGPLVVGLAIDDRRRALRQLALKERQFRESIACSPVGMVLADLDGSWSIHNAAFTRMLGYTEEEGRALPAGHVVHPDDKADVSAQTRRLLKGDSDVYQAERRYLHRRGDWVWVRSTVSLVRNEDGTPSHFFAQIESIQARREAEAKLAAERNRLETTLRSIVDAVVTTDEAGVVTYANPAAIALLGQPLSAFEGRRLEEVLVLTDALTSKTIPGLLGRCVARLDVIDRNEPCVLHRPDGSLCHISETASPVLDAEGRFAGAVIVIRDASELYERTRELTHRATHDVLTNLVNRFEFERRAKDCFERTRLLDRPTVLLMIDLDRFKQVNDGGGHAAGDSMLQLVANAIHAEVRDSDTVARLGGDEFAVILDGCRLERAVLVGEKILTALNAIRLPWSGADYTIGASIGGAQSNADHADTAAWMRAADSACYDAKRLGRGRMRFAESGRRRVAND